MCRDPGVPNGSHRVRRERSLRNRRGAGVRSGGGARAERLRARPPARGPRGGLRPWRARAAPAFVRRLPLGDAGTSVVAAHDADRILQQAGASGSDLIVLGPERLTGGNGLFGTSVAGEVLARAHCAVLLTKRIGRAAAAAR